ncbi:MAG: DUF5666 domain-containing protein [Geminicoccaceae bacterium]
MTRLALSVALILGLLVGCAERQGADPASGESSITTSRSSASEGGIGGTGAPSRGETIASDDKEGGIGGTGIFGTITSFGSIVVNGQTVKFGEEVVQSREQITGRELPLSVGSAVIVEARSEEDGWIAERVALFLPLVGPVSVVDPASGTLSVMGTSILLEDDAAIVDRRGHADGEIIDLGAIAMGDRLAVSGIWKGGEIVASRIDRLDDDGPHAASGLLLLTSDGMLVGGTQLTSDCCSELDAPAYVQLFGRYLDDLFEVDRLETGVTLLFSRKIERLIVEAFLARDPIGEGFHLSGFGIPADQSATVKTLPGVRSLFVGAYDDAFHIRQSVVLPAGTVARENVLQSLGDLTRPD